MLFPLFYVLADNGNQMSVISLVGWDKDVVVILALADIVARQVMCLDAEVELGVMENNGLTVRVVDGEVNMEGVAMMEDGRLVRRGVRDAERCLQAVRRLEKLSQKSLKFHPVDLVFL